jgi:hypothetical protein
LGPVRAEVEIEDGAVVSVDWLPQRSPRRRVVDGQTLAAGGEEGAIAVERDLPRIGPRVERRSQTSGAVVYLNATAPIEGLDRDGNGGVAWADSDAPNLSRTGLPVFQVNPNI